MLPFKSLDAATAAGPGESRDLETVAAEHTLYAVESEDTPAGPQVLLEGSPDGTLWVELTGVSWGHPETPAPKVASASAVPPHWCRFVRARLVFDRTDLGVPEVTAWIASHVPEED